MRSVLSAVFIIAFLVNPLSAAELTGTLRQIQESGKIRIGYRQAQPPMSFLGEDGLPAGYSVDICKAVVAGVTKKIGSKVQVDYVPVTAEDRFQALADNRIDILCGSTTKTLSRSELVDFTLLTYPTGASLMTLRSRNIGSDFSGRKIGVTKATTTASALEELLKETGTKADLVMLNSASEGMKALEKEEIDALAADQVVLVGLASTAADPANHTLFRDLFSYEPLALAVRKDDGDFRLVADRVIAGLCQSKEMRNIYDTWLGKFSNTRPSAFEALVKLNEIPE